MEKKRTLKKITMAVGVAAMSVGLFNSFNLEAQSTGWGECENSVEVSGSIITVTICDRTTDLYGYLLNTPCNRPAQDVTCVFTNWQCTNPGT